MKKTLIAIMTIAALAASCNKAEVIEVNRQAIAFGEAFVDNATKALDDDYSGTKKLEQFAVYGTVTGNTNTAVNLFAGETVTRGDKNFGDAWSCTKTEYWVPSCSYSFMAIVDGTVADTNKDDAGMPTKIDYTVANAGGDLLLATATASTTAAAVPEGTGISNGIVAFNFSHLLSKVYFSFVNGFNNDDYQYKVNEITVSNVPANGTYTIAEGNWAQTGDATATLSFGEMGTLASGATVSSVEDQMILPVEQTVTIKFSYDVVFKGQTLSTIPVEKTLTHTFAKSTVYKITAELPALGNEIKFTVTSVDGFTTGSDVPVTL